MSRQYSQSRERNARGRRKISGASYRVVKPPRKNANMDWVSRCGQLDRFLEGNWRESRKFAPTRRNSGGIEAEYRSGSVCREEFRDKVCEG